MESAIFFIQVHSVFQRALSPKTEPRHCEERSDEAIQGKDSISKPWIASPSSGDEGSQ
jgi:hypothetical protein